MASLPPYSTFRTDSKQMMFPQATSHGNVLTFTPPGFKQSLNVKFPDSRLPVCEKCKKNFKTRDMCRVRNGHTAPPWTTAYICMTLDDSCTDANGKYVDKPFTVRMVPWQPYCVKESFDPKTPVCAGCKRTNRTRSFCRERHRHRQLPWCTVYCVLSAVDTVDDRTIVAAPSRPVEESSKSESETDKESPAKGEESKEATSPSNGDSESKADSPKEGDENTKPPEKEKAGEGDDINQIAESRTFLAKVSCKAISIQWLELAESDGNDGGAIPNIHQHMDPSAYGMGGPGMPMPPDPNHPPYYHHPNMYAAQHQHALKNQQQYFFPMQRHASPYANSWPVHHYQQHPHILHGQTLASQASSGAPPPPPPPAGEGLSPPVTAGEAAASLQLKRSRELTDDRGQSPMHHPPPGHSHPGPPPGGSHGQQQQWIMYQQMYQSGLPPMSHASAYPPQGGRHMPQPEGGSGGPMMHPPEGPYNRPQSPPNSKDHDADSKRQRLG